MVESSPHIIRHVSLDLQYTGKVNGWEIQEEVKQWLNALIERLEYEFEKISKDGKWLSYDSLNIEIDANGNYWKDDAINHAVRQIVDKLQLKTLKSQENAIPSRQQHFTNIFLHYLQHGNLPWNAIDVSVGNWEQDVEKLFESIDAPIFLSFIVTIRNNASAIQRLVGTINPISLINALQRSSGLLETEQRKIIRDAIKLNAKLHLQNEAITKSILTYLLYAITGSEKLVVTTALLQQVQLDIPFKNAFDKQDFESKAFKTLQEISIQKMPVAKAIAKMESDVFHQNKKPLIKVKATDIRDSNIIGERIQKQHLEQPEYNQAEPIYISNAGLVIIAAYLPRLFQNLGWWKDNKWWDSNAAVCLVHYLSTGQPEMKEFELVLPKVLCGLQPEDAVDTTYFFLSEQIQQEAADLLASVIAYWSVLKDTSMDGLCGSFLLRDGKLWKNENKWYLTVEQKGYDMLLQQIPWNISMVQLPWMDEMLTINWM